eukprot:SAG25_NODE_9038_length_391_cov_0.712329_1_plen_21_part_10
MNAVHNRCIYHNESANAGIVY